MGHIQQGWFDTPDDFATDPVPSKNGLPKCDPARPKSDFTEAWISQNRISQCGDCSSRARLAGEGDNAGELHLKAENRIQIQAFQGR